MFEVGEKVRVVNQRGEHWNQDGLMDRYMGKTVTITQTGDIKIKEDKGRWFWQESDFEKIA